jgi:hypothetical protein
MSLLGRAARSGGLALALAGCASAVAAAPAVAGGSALSPLAPVNPACGAAGAINGLSGTLCGTAGGDALTSGVTSIALSAMSSFVLGGAGGVLHDTAALLGRTTAPQLQTTWFSSTYWRMAEVATLLTLPFLFAAAVQALMRSDLALLARAALGYLPLAMLAIAIAAPLTALLLAASDELCTFVSAAAGNQSAHFLNQATLYLSAVSAGLGSPGLVFFVGLFLMAATFVLWVELLMRMAAVYVIVLMLPLAFAVLVWPARRVWAVRAVELLVALILSKFAIVSVLSLGGAAISASLGSASVTSLMAGAVLCMLAAFSPWALMRLIPLAELAGGAAGSLQRELGLADRARRHLDDAKRVDEGLGSITARLRDDAKNTAPGVGDAAAPASAEAVPAPAGAAGANGAAPTPAPADATANEGAAPDPAPADATANEGAAPDPGDDFASQEPIDLGAAMTGARIPLPGDPPETT